MTTSRSTLRSEPARLRILEAAQAVFAESGYDRATVRAIAERASVAPAMLIRYYGGKDGVFAAAVHFDLELPQDLGSDPRSVSRALVTHFFARWERADSGGELVALLRASVDHAAAREKMLAVFGDQLAPVVTQVVGARWGAEAAALIASQMLGLVFCRYILALPALSGLSDSELADAVAATVEGYLRRGKDADAGRRHGAPPMT